MTKRIDIMAMRVSESRNSGITELLLMRLMRPIGLIGLIGLIGFIGFISLMGLKAQAQTSSETIVIGGNVYGGGNKALVQGNTTVTVQAVDTVENVFGGARQANVGGRAFVNIDGEHATGDIFITNVYGGNDIAGVIGTSTVPAELTEVIPEPTTEQLTTANKTREEWRANYKKDNPEKNDIDNTWNAFVRSSRSAKEVTEETGTKTVEDKWILIGSVYGGGNGDFYYYNAGETTTGTGATAVTTVTYKIYNTKAECEADTDKKSYIAIITKKKGEHPGPELAKTYLELKGGELAHVYGGGNNATVTENTTICINNTSDVCQGYVEKAVTKLWTDDPDKVTDLTAVGPHTFNYYLDQTISALKKMAKLNTFQSDITSFEFNHARVFGGNNKADMAITPTWNLQQGMIRDLFSGGNEGRMISPTGLLLEIDPIHEYNDKLIVNNVYGGCRRADVRPLDASGEDVTAINPPGYNFPPGLAARTLVRGGQITNVYGGNDISGRVYGGSAVGIYTNVLGNVYGGGNGSYAYTDNAVLGAMDMYKDFYYNPIEILGLPGTDFTPKQSIEALNKFRPNAEQVSIRLKGNPPTTGRPDFTIIKGSVFCGGNSASLNAIKKNPLVELKIGSYVIADNVFLANNGEKMVDPAILELYAGRVKDGEVLKDDEGNVITTDSDDGDGDYSKLTLTKPAQFADYMEGVNMYLQPNIVFDNVDNGDPENYVDYMSYVGSFFCGGNVGSMSIPDKNIYTVNRGLNIYEKFVGGCNNANVAEGPYNAAYEGGVLGAKNERGANNDEFYTDTEAEDGNIKDRLQIDLKNLTITPLRWEDETKTSLIWNTNKWYDYTKIDAGTTLEEGDEYYTYNSTTKEYTKHTIEGSDTYTVQETDEYYELYEDFLPVPNNAVDEDTRLLGGNVYGGCYESGHVNGNVVINLNDDMLKRDEVFGTGTGPYGNKASGVELENQRLDIMAVALSVFGAGCGEETEIWGSTTVNLNQGYTYQIFGGGEKGVVGKGVTKTKDDNGVEVSYRDYAFDPRYSTTVNLNGEETVTSSTEKKTGLAETEFIYGGGNEGDVCGNSYVYLGNGRIYDAFGGASDADILGHTEVYIGRQPKTGGGYQSGFPWIQDIVYGGNDFGGTIWGGYEDGYDFTARIRNYDADKDLLHGKPTNDNPGVLKSSTYVEYLTGRVDTIFGGGYGFYNYANTSLYGPECATPVQESSFVNIRPEAHEYNALLGVFGGGTGFPNNRNGDKAQDRSYVLIDIPDDMNKFAVTEVFGSGSYNGLGMRFIPDDTFDDEFDPDQLSAITDLIHGQIGNVYGGSYNEGVTARTVINVPVASSIKVNNIFGGSFGTQILPPCDVFESNINYHSNDATVLGTIYGGNNNERRTLYTKVNISSPVWSNKAKGYTAKVFGAGRGIDTWSEYTEVNLLPKPEGVEGDYTGAMVYEVYGGGEMGHVLNAESVQKYMELYKNGPSDQIAHDAPYWNDDNKWTLTNGVRTVKDEYKAKWESDWADAWTLGDYYTPDKVDEDGNVIGYDYTGYASNVRTNLNNTAIVTVDKLAERIDDRDYTGYSNEAKAHRYQKYNTNVHIYEGATVAGYAYGAGLGDANTALSGDVYGTSYIALLGGTVEKDLYAAGTVGAVYDLFGVGGYDASSNTNGFTASANAYIKGGSARNVYGGGWKGSVGHHPGEFKDPYYDFTNNQSLDNLGETHVVIGIDKDHLADVPENLDASDFYFANGIPTVQRNAYGGGEGGSIWGTTHLTINNGMIGYRYKNSQYVPELDDASAGDNKLIGSGNAFGGGYIVNSYVDYTNVKMFGGTIRGSLYGGSEVGPIGRGTMKQFDTQPAGSIKNGDATIFRAGKTHVEMFNGKVLRNVFGGGRGKDSWGGDGTQYMDAALVATLDMKCKGYVFGQTEVNIHGGEIGTATGVEDGQEIGNVFGGCDEGCVYSAYELADHKLYIGKKSGVRYNEGIAENASTYNDEGYYYKANGTGFVKDDGTSLGSGEKILTEDCKVLVEPWLQATAAFGSYAKGDYVPTSYLNTLPKKTTSGWTGDWLNVDAGTGDQERGVIIHNAVFAGGNRAEGSTQLNANTNTVFGNATASIHDVYHRDLITIGTGHIGGLYGDGNLTLVDGYRELNITNYGTDYYNINTTAQQLTAAEYNALSPRERFYYEMKYQCKATCTDKNSNEFSVGSTLSEAELLARFLIDDETSVTANGTAILIKNAEDKWEPNPTYWETTGMNVMYQGRILNTIQRADFCGVFGSRMVMWGAEDRVPENHDNTNYTINRVRELSLNKKVETGSGGSAPRRADDTPTVHGNYFGIYNNVNFLGALTSDVDFNNNVRTTRDTTSPYTADGKTFYQWKQTYWNKNQRNNGSSHNLVALASGVHLELITEKSTGPSVAEKDWGYITGVVELDLINVATGVGGGYVYAKNEHGVRSSSGKTQTVLTDLNKNDGSTTKAVSYKEFTYAAARQEDNFETSGNFVICIKPTEEKTRIILDDCFDRSGKYYGSEAVKAHYWFIKGQTYIYDQFISAFTGAPSAYSEDADIPLTIDGSTNGSIKLMDVQPNLYAYYAYYDSETANGKLGGDQKLIVDGIEYGLNDPIDYWTWSQLLPEEQILFVPETYVTTAECTTTVGTTLYPAGTYPAGTVLTEADYIALRNAHIPESGDAIPVSYNGENVDFDDIFRSSNNMSHNTGFMLTYQVNNPNEWNQWYTAETNNATKNQTGGTGYVEGPTYRYNATTAALLGQRHYSVGEVISWDTYTDYEGYDANGNHNYEDTGDKKGLKQSLPNGYTFSNQQAEFGPAYVVTTEYTSSTEHYYPGAALSREISGYTAPALVSTKTIQLSEDKYIYTGQLMSEAEKDQYKTDYPALAAEIESNAVTAYYCTSPGQYGGNYYVTGQNYSGKDWSAMTESERSNFSFNYDALDLLIDPTYGWGSDGTPQPEGQKYQYDGKDFTTPEQAENNEAGYSLEQVIGDTGTVPLETSTLYVARGSDIKDLSQEKIITVIYKYIYEGHTDETGNTTPIEEDHVVNIHIRFKDGKPTIEEIQEPDIVLPGTSIVMATPKVTSNAFQVIGGGWELFADKDEANSHINGREYVPSTDPVYWYQDDHYIAYYANTYFGKTYTKPVPIHVANYHDLADVMSDLNKTHHMYIDNKNVKRAPKIYINNYSASGKNGLDLFKDLYDLSLRTTVATEGNLNGHALLNERVKGGNNLEFFLRTNIDHSTTTWSSIGSGTDDPCFSGTLHGDGYTITGLNYSLFDKLCGDVYNLGVTGSFTGAGVAEQGGGYVENCWISTTGEPDGSKYAVFGNPERESDDARGLRQIVNSYYPTGLNYKTGTSSHGLATAKPAAAFYNGEVAYDLNSFYLNKRFYNHETLGEEVRASYKFLQRDETGNLKETADEGYYPKDKTTYAQYADLGYVESRYRDGDYRYAGGEIPTVTDRHERTYEETTTTEDPDTHETVTTTTEKTGWFPVWPEDYLFFGQNLTFGYDNSKPHQNVPSHFSSTNRVYRAPAYYRNSTMGTVHFNPDAYLAAKEKLTDEQIEDGVTAREAYPRMTAVDFAGHNNTNEKNGTYGQGLIDATSTTPQTFYPPLLDDDGLTSITNCDETQNLLVYAPAETSTSGYANKATYDVLTDYFVDPVYADYYNSAQGYRLVDKVNTTVMTAIHGHLVQSDLTATNDHLLVDKQDFNAPFGYTFASNKRMWYQRTPEDAEYVDLTQGWQGISLPFTAELVTTHQKGEITHFYSGSATSKNGTGSKIGHEYWLREFNAGGTLRDGGKVFEAKFDYPTASGVDKNYTNTFLWDYYYKNTAVHNQKDKNDDTYQTYYEKAHTHNAYPLLTGATPYIIGLPGERYYEFDLSGNFEAENTAAPITPLSKQTITFASNVGVSIGKSDSEMAGVTKDGYTFKPSYLNETLEAGTNYVLNFDGDAYTQLSNNVATWNTTEATYETPEDFTAAGTLYTDPDGTIEAESWTAGTKYYTRTSVKTTVNDENKVTPLLSAFRPYFTGSYSAGAPRRIVFSGTNDMPQPDIDERHDGDANGGLKITVVGRNIVVESTRRENMTVRIVTASGITVSTFTIEQGQTVSTPVDMTGVYIVNRTKVVVK